MAPYSNVMPLVFFKLSEDTDQCFTVFFCSLFLLTAFISPSTFFHFLFVCVCLSFMSEIFFKCPMILGCPLIFSSGSQKTHWKIDVWQKPSLWGDQVGTQVLRRETTKHECLQVSPLGPASSQRKTLISCQGLGAGDGWVRGLTAKNSKAFLESYGLVFRKVPHCHFSCGWCSQFQRLSTSPFPYRKPVGLGEEK